MLARKKPFGVVRAKENGIAEIGCTAEIVAVSKEYPDGRLDIITQGVRRFEVMEVSQERAFLQAEVMYLQDEPGSAGAEEIEQALKLHREIIALTGGEAAEPPASGPDNFPFSWSDLCRSIWTSSRPCWA